MIKRLLMVLIAVVGFFAGLAPNATADPPIVGYKVDYNVTATQNGVATASRPTIFSFAMENAITNDWFYVDTPPYHLGIYMRSSPYGRARINARPSNPNPVLGVATYTCTISVNGTVVSRKSGVGSVTCAI